MVQRLVVALPVMVALVDFVRAEDAKEVVIASAKELKGIKAKKITWKKDRVEVVMPNSDIFYARKGEYRRFGEDLRNERLDNAKTNSQGGEDEDNN